MELQLVEPGSSSRELKRRLRVSRVEDDAVLPESIAWQVYLELKSRGEPAANQLFIRALRSLHSRRCIAGVELPTGDSLPNEHRLAGDPFLADLWKAYKKCIANNRTGPASQLLRDIEEQIAAC